MPFQIVGPLMLLSPRRPNSSAAGVMRISWVPSQGAPIQSSTGMKRVRVAGSYARCQAVQSSARAGSASTRLSATRGRAANTPEQARRARGADGSVGADGLVRPRGPFQRLNHAIRPDQERRRDRKTEGLGGLQVDDEAEQDWLLNCEIGRLGALQDLVNVGGG